MKFILQRAAKTNNRPVFQTKNITQQRDRDKR